MRFDAAGFQRFLDFGITRHGVGLVAAVPVNGGCSRFFYQLRDFLSGIPHAQGERDFATQFFQRLVQPPPRRAALLPDAGIDIIKDINRNDRLAAIARCQQAGIIGKAEVAAEPENNGRVAQVLSQYLKPMRASTCAGSGGSFERGIRKVEMPNRSLKMRCLVAVAAR
ncbi:MAG: hypothetical protein K0R10_738 [Alphaproteobacteria bacterium]|nr:hypothetical protein [Alphaproteobacteria bacterium]